MKLAMKQKWHDSEYFIEVEFLKNTTLVGEMFDWYGMDGPWYDYSKNYEKGEKAKFWVVKNNPKSFRVLLDKKDERMYNEGMDGSIGWVNDLSLRKDRIKWKKIQE